MRPQRAGSAGGPPTSRTTRDALQARARARMVSRLEAQGINEADVLRAMGSVPRHAFVDEALQGRAYDDVALPIGLGQSISQPFVVARMTALVLDSARALDRPVLEVGFGCGYQTAVLAALGIRVYAVERIARFVREARERMHALGIGGAHLRHADGASGWQEFAPFAAILVAAAAPRVPPLLAGQLAVGARLVMPVGGPDGQHLTCVVREPERFRQVRLDAVSFVPLVAGAALA